MKIRAVILAGGEGTRLKSLTAKRAKPAVLFAGKYRIIDFTLSNCVNSQIYDVMILAQYRPQSLIAHIGSGSPWDLNLYFTGGVRILTPYKAQAADWFVGTADAVQQNFSFIKRGNPDHILILSGDHIYAMDYQKMIDFHVAQNADLTIACIEVPVQEASRYGILHYDQDFNVISFVEKPEQPPSNTANMGIYLFKQNSLNQVLWEDHLSSSSKHDFGKDIIPAMLDAGKKVCAYPYSGYWVDVGTIESYWQAQMELLHTPPSFNLYQPEWIIHTRTEERPPAFIHGTAVLEDSLVSDGCKIEPGAYVKNCILSPGVVVKSNAVVHDSIIFTDSMIHESAYVYKSILDKRVIIEKGCQVGSLDDRNITIIGRNSIIPSDIVIQGGAIIGTDVNHSDYSSKLVKSGENLLTRRLPYEI